MKLPEESFDFLGYSTGRLYGKDGRPYIGTRPSRKAIRSLLRRIHDATTPHKTTDSPKSRVAEINRLLRGWAAYFNQGRFFRPTKWCAGMCNGVFNDG